eukprot:1159934-Pelagomonas_calceolata.AAC.1
MVMLLKSLKLILGPGVSQHDFHKIDVPLFWKELARDHLATWWTLETIVVDVAGAEHSLFPPCPPQLLNEYQELVLGTLFIVTTCIAPGRREPLFGQGFGGLRQSALPMSIEARPDPRGLLLMPLSRILLAILGHSVTMFDMMGYLHPERMILVQYGHRKPWTSNIQAKARIAGHFKGTGSI